MAHEDFLREFAKAHKIASVDVLLRDHSQRYSFQINSRNRAQKMIGLLETSLNTDFSGKRILDVGCAYGSFAIELANRGAQVVGIDISDKWLALAQANAENEVSARFINCDASSFRARAELQPYGPFDIIIINDVFEHIYDTAGLLQNLQTLMSDDGIIYFKVPNGMATRSVLLEGHKKVFGISLLAPDYWSYYIPAPFHIYYRRWDYYQSLFQHFGFGDIEIFNSNTDSDIEITKRHIRNDLGRIRRSLKRDNYATKEPYAFLQRAIRRYAEEIDNDIAVAAWDELFFKYRVTFWEGLLRRKTAKNWQLAMKDRPAVFDSAPH